MSEPPKQMDIKNAQLMRETFPQLADTYANYKFYDRQNVVASLGLLHNPGDPELRKVLPNTFKQERKPHPPKKIPIPQKVKNKNISVLFAPAIVAGNAQLLSQYLRKEGYKTSIVDYLPNYLGYKADLTFTGKNPQELRTFSDQALQYAQKFDVIIFEFSCSFKFLPPYDHDLSPERPYYWDIAHLKNQGKVILCSFSGSDVRSQSLLHFKILDHLGLDIPEPPSQNFDQFNYIRRLATLADGFLAVDRFDLFLPRLVPFWETPINLKQWPFKKNRSNKIETIITAPTSKRKKNYELIEAIIKANLPGRPDVSHLLLQNAPHDKILAYKSKADLAMVNVGNSFGLGGVEFMALGAPVMAANPPGLRYSHRDEAPVISFSDIGQMNDKFRALLDGDMEIANFSQAGRSYVEKYHNIDVVGGALTNYLSQALDSGFVGEIFSKKYSISSRLWEMPPEKVPSFKYYDIAVPAFCLLGDYERAIRDCNQAVTNKYRSLKFASWSLAIIKYFNVDLELYEKSIKKIKAGNNKQQLEMITHYENILRQVDLLVQEICHAQNEAKTMFKN